MVQFPRRRPSSDIAPKSQQLIFAVHEPRRTYRKLPLPCMDGGTLISLLPYDNVMVSTKRVTSTLRHLPLLASVLFSMVTLSQSQIRACPNSALTGHWQGAMSREGADVSVSFDFVCVDAALRVSF